MRRPDSTAGRRRWSVRTQIVVVTLTVLVPTLAAFGALAYRMERLRVSAAAVTSTYSAVNTGHRLLEVIGDMQQAVHAYALTGNQMFMDAYGRARIALSTAETDAAASLRGDEVRVRRLLDMVQAVDEFFTDWEDRLPTLQAGSDDEGALERIAQDEADMQRISGAMAKFVKSQEAAIVQQMAADERARKQLYFGALAASLGTVVLLAALATFLGRSIARPIEQVAEAAHRLGAGERDQRVEPHGGRETRVLAEAFNQMAGSLQEAEATLAARNRELEQSGERLSVANEDLRERQRESDDFLHVLSHDLRAPLINIQGFSKRLQTSMDKVAELMAAGAPPEEPIKQLGRMGESLKFINAGTGKIDQLIARLLEIARLTTKPGERRWVDMYKLAHDVAASCRFQSEERGITVVVEPLPLVFGDPVQLNQVVTNLVDNAIKYMGDRPVKTVAIACTVQGDRYRFAVQDSGPGIAPKDQEKVFRLFSRLAPNATQGEGIGLAAVRAIVNRNGGRIWVESTVDVGSTFFFSLPRPPEAEAPPADAAAQAARAPAAAQQAVGTPA